MVVRLAVVLALLVAFISTPFAQSSEKPMRAAGRVEAVAQDSLTIVVGGDKMTLTVDDATKVIGKGLDPKAKESSGKAALQLIKPSDSVVVKYLDEGGKRRATEINVRLISKP